MSPQNPLPEPSSGPTIKPGAVPWPLVAGILTYNRPDALRECVRRLAEQTRPPDKLVIWNNGVPGSAAEALAEFVTPFPLICHDSAANLGATGGYHELVRAILEEPGVAGVYLIDDDCFPHPNNLELLERALRGDQTGRVAAIRSLPEKEIMRHGRLTEPFVTQSAGWCGALYRAEAVRQAGGPLRDLFFSYGEWEWSTRLKHAGWQLLAHPKVRFEVLTDDDPRGRTLRGASMRHSKHRIAYYKLRNAIWMGEHLPHMRRKCGWYRRLEVTVASLVFSPDRKRTWKALQLARRHANAGRLGWCDLERELD